VQTRKECTGFSLAELGHQPSLRCAPVDLKSPEDDNAGAINKSSKKAVFMNRVTVKIKGTAPLLMNRFVMEKNEQKEARRRDQQFDPKEDAEKALYRNSNGCYAPSAWLEASLRETAKNFKGKGRASLKATVLATVFVEPDEIPLNKDTYDEIDQRPAVIQRNRIVKSRQSLTPGN